MSRQIGYDSTSETVSNGSSLSSPIVIDADKADTAYVYVDDTTGSAVAETYDLTVEVEKTMPHDGGTDSSWMTIEAGVSGSTAQFHEITPFPGGVQARLDLTNSGAAGEEYRIVFETRSEGAN